MCIVAFITEPQVIDRMLDHVRRTRNGKTPFPCPARASPDVTRQIHPER